MKGPLNVSNTFILTYMHTDIHVNTDAHARIHTHTYML